MSGLSEDPIYNRGAGRQEPGVLTGQCSPGAEQGQSQWLVTGQGAQQGPLGVPSV